MVELHCSAGQGAEIGNQGLGTGDSGLGTGDWGLGTRDWGSGLRSQRTTHDARRTTHNAQRTRHNARHNARGTEHKAPHKAQGTKDGTRNEARGTRNYGCNPIINSTAPSPIAGSRSSRASMPAWRRAFWSASARAGTGPRSPTRIRTPTGGSPTGAPELSPPSGQPASSMTSASARAKAAGSLVPPLTKRISRGPSGRTWRSESSSRARAAASSVRGGSGSRRPAPRWVRRPAPAVDRTTTGAARTRPPSPGAAPPGAR